MKLTTMKKSISVSLVLVLATVIAITVILPAIITGQISASAYTIGAADNTINGTYELSSNQDLIPLTVSRPRIVPSNVWDRPYEEYEANVYTQGGRRLFHLRETGMVVTEDGVPVMNPGNAQTTGDTTMVIYCAYTETFIDGANRSLAIFLDSRLNRHYLKAGGRFVTPINLNNNVFLINLNARDGQRLIYTFRNRYDRGWVNGIFGERFGYRFYDMNGRHISNDYIAEFRRPPWWRIAIGFVIPVYGLGMLITGNHIVPVVQILNKTTLRELTTLISHTTYHPWATLECDVTNNPVVTEDGRIIHVNPRTQQLTDFFGFALFNSGNGLPIVFHNGDIITTDLQQQNIQDATLRESVTVWALLESGTDFYMGSITTFFGQFDVPVFRRNDDPHNPDWGLMNGDDANGIIDDMQPSEVLDGESFSDWLSRVNIGRGISWFMTAIAVIGLIIVVVIAFIIIGAVSSMINPKNKSKDNARYDYDDDWYDWD